MIFELASIICSVLIWDVIVGFIISIICKKYFKKYSLCGYALGDFPLNWILASLILTLLVSFGVINGAYTLLQGTIWAFGIIVLFLVCIFAILLKKLRNK